MQKLGKSYYLNNPFVCTNKVVVPTFFEVTHLNSPSKISYILGTHHCYSKDALPSPCKAIINKVGNLIIEHKFIDSICELQEVILKANQSNTKQAWYTELTHEEKYLLCNIFCRTLMTFGIKETSPNQMPLYLVRQLLAYQLIYSQGMDAVIMNGCLENKQPIYELDDPDLSAHFNPANTRPNDVGWVRFLLKVYKDPLGPESSKIRQLSRSKQKDYALGKLSQKKGFLVRLFIKKLKHETQLLSDRNINWLPKFIYYHKSNEGTNLFAFGAGHLAGQDGMLNLLVQNGFKIRRMDADGGFKPFDIQQALPKSRCSIC